ncbi:CCHC-type domain-containing protein [Trichonephila clavata]|uniref:CCHC-type domain-containing protein n=1 Tax=Trichonephila clavata TaxID=2740835 RepID=A0A8X6IKS7_TRICU|nr:CCHC-type domain-containing protein [Trichonephila clavata]
MFMMLFVEIGNAQDYQPKLQLKRLLRMRKRREKAFVKDDSLAQLILVGNMDDSNAELTSVCNTAKSVWEKLLSVYEQRSGQRLDRLMEKFFRSEKELEDDIASHIAKLQRNFSELNDELRRVAKTTLPDLLLMSRIMSTLPSEYFEFKSVWESVPIEERSVNKLTERLRLIEMRLPSKSTDSTALVATRKKVFKKPERKCYVCRKPGHLAKNCWKKGSKPKVEVMLLCVLWKVFQKVNCGLPTVVPLLT